MSKSYYSRENESKEYDGNFSSVVKKNGYFYEKKINELLDISKRIGSINII